MGRIREPSSFSTVEAFDYELPELRIAQRPVHPYDAAKVLCVDRRSGRLRDSVFSELREVVGEGDILVFNNSKVISARLFGSLQRDKRIEVELLVLSTGAAEGEALAMGRPLKKMRPGDIIELATGERISVVERVGDYEVAIRTLDGLAIQDLLERAGVMPVPPYIRKGRGDDQDQTDYQSMFAEIPGSVAAPTASLHFTPRLIEGLEADGCGIERVTLHLGTASFRTLWMPGGDLTAPGIERLLYQPSLLSRLQEARDSGSRVIAVGTSVVRALETMALYRDAGRDKEEWLDSDLFIAPGFEFSVVDAIITNFHQPRTSHLLLVQAFLGLDNLQRAYRHALERGYRFLSYGDGMLIY